jgi:hypothetical protein
MTTFEGWAKQVSIGNDTPKSSSAASSLSSAGSHEELDMIGRHSLPLNIISTSLAFGMCV